MGKSVRKGSAKEAKKYECQSLFLLRFLLRGLFFFFSIPCIQFEVLISLTFFLMDGSCLPIYTLNIHAPAVALCRLKNADRNHLAMHARWLHAAEAIAGAGNTTYNSVSQLQRIVDDGDE